MHFTRRSAAALALSSAAALTLAGCASGDEAAEPADDDLIAVVASTDVYGQIAEEIGGEFVAVSSIVSSPTQDPHSFEPSARDSLTVSNADLIIENGGGYDAFVDDLIESTEVDAAVITAVEHSHSWPDNAGHTDDEAADADADHDAHDHEHVEGFNEHVWFDPHTIEHVADAIATELGEIDPDNGQAYADAAAAFAAEVARIETTLAAIDDTHGGEAAFVTEPLSVYLLEAAGLENVTPDAFSEAVEEGQDVAPATLLDATKLLESGDVAVVITNTQTGGAETAQIVEDAESADIPVIAFSETLPDGTTYISWMQANIDTLGLALTS